ncbi:MAG: hypothetical protein SVU32_07165, partial [Candidatus Nanohaloarchaea archaeon]|nr:hypothetical protein [Candidatus Nanohaloarchaea archaeon]
SNTQLLAIMTVMLNEVQPIQAVSILFAVAVVVLLLYDMRTGQLWELPQAVSVLLILLTLGTATTFVLHYNSETSRTIHETFGPGIGPIAYADELTQPSPHNIRRLNEFRHLPVTEDIVHPPGKVPPRITRNKSKTVNITLVAKEVVAEVANDSFYYYWTYNGTVPGPILRVASYPR